MTARGGVSVAAIQAREAALYGEAQSARGGAVAGAAGGDEADSAHRVSLVLYLGVWITPVSSREILRLLTSFAPLIAFCIPRKYMVLSFFFFGYYNC